MKTIKISAAIILATLSLASCNKKGCTDELADNYSEKAKKDDGSCVYSEHYGTVEVNIDHVWGMAESAFALNTQLIHPMTNDTLTFTTFKYYVSNFKLKNSDGTWWTHPESYFLVDLSAGIEASLTLNNVPTGTYTEMSYVLGVDSARNVSGAQSGALAVSNSMFWSWSTGYIMLKCEGTSPNAGTGSFSYHLGGFSGANNIVTSKSVVFGTTNLIITESHTSEIHMKANPARLWHTLGSVSTTSTIHMPGANAKTMASDYYGNLSFDHIHN